MNNNLFGKRLYGDNLTLLILFLISLLVIGFSILALRFITNVILCIVTYILLIAFSITACAIIGVFISILLDNYSEKKTKKFIQEHLTCEYKDIYINEDCLNSLDTALNSKKRYKAKLNTDGIILLRIENTQNKNDFLETTISNFSWFRNMFKFEEK